MKPRTVDITTMQDATVADLRALGAYVTAVADIETDVKTTIGPFTVEIRVGVCKVCHGSGRVWPGNEACLSCEGRGRT